MNKIKEKVNLLKVYYDSEERKVTTLNRVQCFKVAGEYMRKMKTNSFLHLYNSGYYPNILEQAIQTDFQDWLVNETVNQLSILNNIN